MTETPEDDPTADDSVTMVESTDGGPGRQATNRPALMDSKVVPAGSKAPTWPLLQRNWA